MKLTSEQAMMIDCLHRLGVSPEGTVSIMLMLGGNRGLLHLAEFLLAHPCATEQEILSAAMQGSRMKGRVRPTAGLCLPLWTTGIALGEA